MADRLESRLFGTYYIIIIMTTNTIKAFDIDNLNSTHLFMKLIEFAVSMSHRPFIWSDVYLNHINL